MLFLCLVILLDCVLLVFDAFDAGFDGCPNRSRPGSDGKIERFGYFILAGAGFLRGREACRSSGAAPGRQHGSQSHKLTCFFVHGAIGIIKTCKFFDFHDLPPSCDYFVYMTACLNMYFILFSLSTLPKPTPFLS